MKTKILVITCGALLFTGCTKLNETLNDRFIVTPGGSSSTATGLLTHTYNDLGSVFHDQDKVFSLEENTSDECLVPTRGGDWDDNGVWRVLHAHAWDATHSQSATVFTMLGTLESDATTVLALGPTTEQGAEATFLRSMAQFYLLDLYGQVPYRTVPNYNTIGPAPVMDASDAVDTLVTNLTAIIPLLQNSNAPYQASPDAAMFLLMKVLLNKGAYLNRQTPTFASADMAQVVTLGKQIIASPNGYALMTHYFDNFGPNNGGFSPGVGYSGASTERILAYDNNGSAATASGINNSDVDARWMMTLHYNSWDQVAPNAGWNGFSTIGDFYYAFDATDTRRGNVAYPGVTNVSGLKVGLLEGIQFNENNDTIYDRKGNALNFDTSVSLVEANPATLEGDGVRIIKYPPDYSHYTTTPANQLMFFRLADVYLMIAEADLRNNNPTEALQYVNILRAVRGAPALTALTLLNSDNLYDGTTLLAERQKEMYWESWRRQDLIRFGVFLQPWTLKTTDDPKYLLFPIPATQLVSNPNLKQNPGY